MEALLQTGLLVLDKFFTVLQGGSFMVLLVQKFGHKVTVMFGFTELSLKLESLLTDGIIISCLLDELGLGLMVQRLEAMQVILN